jgi:hypothetical protein
MQMQWRMPVQPGREKFKRKQSGKTPRNAPYTYISQADCDIPTDPGRQTREPANRLTR